MNMTDQQLNEAVAKKLGLDFRALTDNGAFYFDYLYGNRQFSPATDPAAALWALERLCTLKMWGYSINKDAEDKQVSVEFSKEDEDFCFGRQWGDTLHEAIYRAIVGACEDSSKDEKLVKLGVT